MPAYFTMDAGPNVKVICKASDIPAIMEELGKVFPSEKLIPTLPGEGVRTLTEDEWNASFFSNRANRLLGDNTLRFKITEWRVTC